MKFELFCCCFATVNNNRYLIITYIIPLFMKLANNVVQLLGINAVACTDFLKGRGGKGKKRAHIARPHHCRGHFSTRFGFPKGTLARIFQQLGHKGGHQLSLGERQDTPWTCRQSITGSHRDREGCSTLTLALRVGLESTINLTCLFLGGGRNPHIHIQSKRPC